MKPWNFTCSENPLHSEPVLVITGNLSVKMAVYSTYTNQWLFNESDLESWDVRDYTVVGDAPAMWRFAGGEFMSEFVKMIVGGI